MALAVFVAASVLTQVVAPASPAEPSAVYVEVGYQELTAGNEEQAIARIRANRELESDDPAALINLGSAHARLGRMQEARGFYLAAIGSHTRYDLQLADGRWIDSRRAARMALDMQAKGAILALR